MNLNWFRLAWVLLGVLLIGSATLWLGSREATTFPSSLSTAPSGLSALADSLELAGFKVRTERQSKPVLSKDDLLIVPTMSTFKFAGLVLAEKKSASWESKIADHARSGGSVIFLYLPTDFRENSFLLQKKKVRITEPEKPEMYVANAGLLYEMGDEWDEDFIPDNLIYFLESDNWFAGARSTGKGKMIFVNDATIFTNRFLDQYSHGTIALGLVRMLAKPDGNVVFVETEFNSDDPGILDVLGAPVKTGVYQVVFLVLVIAWSLGKRFGLPDRVRARQSGEKELLDAVQNILARTGSVRMAIKMTINHAEDRIRRAKHGAVDLAHLASQSHAVEIALKRLKRIEVGEPVDMDWTDAIANFDAAVSEAIGASTIPSRKRGY